MKKIRDLDRLRSPFPRAFGISSGAISRDDLYFWMFPQPFLQSLRLPIRQKLNWLAGFFINQNRPVPVTTAQCKIIHTEDANFAFTRLWQGAHSSDQSIRTDLDAHFFRRSCSSLTTQGQSNCLQGLIQTIGFPRKGDRHFRNPFYKQAPSAFLVEIKKATNQNQQTQLFSATWQIVERPLVAAVNLY